MNVGFARLGEEECESCDLQIKHVEEFHPKTKITRSISMVEFDEDVVEVLEKMIDEIAERGSKRNISETKKKRKASFTMIAVPVTTLSNILQVQANAGKNMVLIRSVSLNTRSKYYLQIFKR